MGFKGFGLPPGNIKIEAWPSLGLETATSYAVYWSGKAVFHLSDAFAYETLPLDRLDIEEDSPNASALIEPTHLIYPSPIRKKPRVVKRSVGGEAIGNLHIYPEPPRKFYFIVGELHCLLHGPGTFLLRNDQEPIGPYGPSESYSDLEVFKLINSLK
ncbi:hypothetical protein K7W42_05580 [Deinococcus sp. HMF7604]|uniref:hypothetical protein n=1 Tax=Deinococcus betulae TaxID=2873312 RepID=UPI001CCE2B97|nr:hypothetical protein [Deinococcus betulae]MBZ9750333.1 hypothetical protein [Deinococcus betulae]